MPSKIESAAPQAELPAVTAINALFLKCRECQTAGDIRGARKIERQVARLVAQVASSEPNSDNHADALQTHEYVLLAVAATSKRKDVQKKFSDAAYVQGAAAATIKLHSAKADLGSVFSANNLGIDLIHTQNRPAEGLKWMLEARTLLTRLAGKKKLPTNILMFKRFGINCTIAKAHYDLGDRNSARKIVTRALSQAPRLDKVSWGDLRDIAKAAELLAQIKLDDIMDADRAKAA